MSYDSVDDYAAATGAAPVTYSLEWQVIEAGTVVGLLESVQIGTPRAYAAPDARDGSPRVWDTSFVRAPLDGPRWLHTTHLDGNVQADRRNHGSLDQAVLVYAAAHYDAWRAELGLGEMGPGGFAENLTVAGLDEDSACIGDSYAIGDALIEVSGPRYPCWKIERRWKLAGLTARVARTGRTGWYCRVKREGMIQAGLPIVLVERPFPDLTVALTNDLGHDRCHDLVAAAALGACPLLNEFWRSLVLRRATERRE